MLISGFSALLGSLISCGVSLVSSIPCWQGMCWRGWVKIWGLWLCFINWIRSSDSLGPVERLGCPLCHPTSGSCILAQKCLRRAPCPIQQSLAPASLLSLMLNIHFPLALEFMILLQEKPSLRALSHGKKPYHESKEPSYQLSLWLVLGVVLA